MNVSLKNLVLRYKWRILFTLILVIIEAITGVLFPLVVGIAINGLLEESYTGVIYLVVVGVTSLVIGSARRFYDTRVYSGIYSEVAPEVIDKEKRKGSSVSSISARANLLIEFIEFLEQSMPQLLNSVISLFGILFIIANLSFNVFLACLSLLVLIVLIYLVTGKFNYSLNEKYNNELERQVEIIESEDKQLIKNYYKSLVRWNIKLSDLETANYFVIWLAVIAVFIYTPITVIAAGVLSYGLVFSILMYVFDYIGSIVGFPIYIQQVIRLKEISSRLSDEL